MEKVTNRGRSLLTGQETIQSLKAKTDARRSWAERVADRMTALFGSMAFLITNAVWFSIWILLNIDLIPGVEPFDPFPFGLLTMIVSLEAIGLAIIVLISQNRAEKVANIRQETDLQVNLITEKELTKVMQMLTLLLKQNGIDVRHDDELNSMLEPIDPEKIEEVLEQEVGKG